MTLSEEREKKALSLWFKIERLKVRTFGRIAIHDPDEGGTEHFYEVENYITFKANSLPKEEVELLLEDNLEAVKEKLKIGTELYGANPEWAEKPIIESFKENRYRVSLYYQSEIEDPRRTYAL